MPAAESAQIDIAEAYKVVSLLQKGAKKITDQKIKKLVLTAGCEIADLVLESEVAVKRAA